MAGKWFRRVWGAERATGHLDPEEEEEEDCRGMSRPSVGPLAHWPLAVEGGEGGEEQERAVQRHLDLVYIIIIVGRVTDGQERTTPPSSCLLAQLADLPTWQILPPVVSGRRRPGRQAGRQAISDRPILLPPPA